ncbi:MAG: DoxX family protein [Candidatus Nanohaloarchaea archaeon]
MTSHKLETEILGREIEFEYAEHWVGYSILLMRVGIGWIFLQGGLQKIFDPSWTAAGYLTHLPAGNPFSFWSLMAGNPFIDAMVAWGLTLIGLALILGVFIRFTAFWGSLMMLLFWASSLEGGLLSGLPVAYGWVVDQHIVYTVMLIALGEIGAGRLVGFDEWLEQEGVVERNPWLKHLLG